MSIEHFEFLDVVDIITSKIAQRVFDADMNGAMNPWHNCGFDGAVMTIAELFEYQYSDVAETLQFDVEIKLDKLRRNHSNKFIDTEVL